jgi:hypothetical protein
LKIGNSLLRKLEKLESALLPYVERYADKPDEFGSNPRGNAVILEAVAALELYKSSRRLEILTLTLSLLTITLIFLNGYQLWKALLTAP